MKGFAQPLAEPNPASPQDSLSEALYHRADWQWALNGGDTVTHGWKPESGFLPYR